jgi:hypothetical protein
MSNDRNIEAAQGISKDDPKAKMLAALAKKQKNQNTVKSSGPTGGSKVGAGQTAGAAPKVHRRKAGSA